MPSKPIEGLHIFFTFRNRRERSSSVPGSGLSTLDKPFAFAYLPIFENGDAPMTDGGHRLALYRYEKQSASASAYLSGPAINTPGVTLLLPPSLAKTLFPLKDFVVVRSFLCSTKLTQDPVILQLLSWPRTLLKDPPALTDTLRKLRYSPEFECMKMVTHIFDALFALLASSVNESGEIDDLVFTALVTLLGT